MVPRSFASVYSSSADFETARPDPESKGVMRRTHALLTLVVGIGLALPAAAEGRKTVFLNQMGGLEAYIEKAAAAEELPIEFIEEAEHPDLKVILGKKFTSFHAEVLYRKNTGRTEDTTLEVMDSKTKKTMLKYDFKWTTDDAGRKAVAAQFVRQLKSKLN